MINIKDLWSLWVRYAITDEYLHYSQTFILLLNGPP